MKYPATKIGNVIFYRVYKDTWLTHDGEYGIIRAYHGDKKECVIARNIFRPFPQDLDYMDYYLVRSDKFPIYKNAREAMKAVCENLYNEEVK